MILEHLQEKYPNGVPPFAYPELTEAIMKYVYSALTDTWHNLRTGDVVDLPKNLSHIEYGKAPGMLNNITHKHKEFLSQSMGTPINTYDDVEAAGGTLDTNNFGRNKKPKIDNKAIAAENFKRAREGGIVVPPDFAKKLSEGHSVEIEEDSNGRTYLKLADKVDEKLTVGRNETITNNDGNTPNMGDIIRQTMKKAEERAGFRS